MAKRKRGDAKLRVIAGGAAPKAVVTRPAQRAAPSTGPLATAKPRSGPPNLRAVIDAEPTEEHAPAERASEVQARGSGLPRALIFVALVIALGGAAYALTRNSIHPPAPAASVEKPADWAASSQVALPPASIPPPQPPPP